VRTFAVHGTFDDCQRMVKDAFWDPVLTASHISSSANSINVGRLLPQMVYYASASLEIWNRDGRKANFVVPSGNLGNVTACTWAREAGLPIDDIVLATNENRTVTEFLESGAWHPRPSVATLASAMDVGNPSNIERLRALFPDRLGEHISAHLVTDDQDPRDHPRGYETPITCGIRTARRPRMSTIISRPIVSTIRGCWSGPRILRSFNEIVEAA